jgi:ABC-2 type transport system permease protein
LMEDVQQGTLDYALTKPADSQVLVSVRNVRIWQLVEVVSGLILLGIGISQVKASVGVLDTVAFLVALGLGAAMLYAFWLVITTGAFWVVRMEHVLELFEGVYQTGRWPIGVYPAWMRYGVTFLVPVGLAVTVPAQAVTSRLHVGLFGAAVVFALALLAFSRWFWRFGLRRYSGASA